MNQMHIFELFDRHACMTLYNIYIYNIIANYQYIEEKGACCFLWTVIKWLFQTDLRFHKVAS